MSFNVSDFRQKMSGDGARPNLFEVEIPNNAPFNFTGNDQFKFFCRATSIPGSTIGTAIVPYFGREIKFAGNRTFADWTVTVVNDEDFKYRDNFEDWMQGINSHVANKRFTGGTGYGVTAKVKQYGKVNAATAIRTYEFVGVFPVDLSEITLDWGDNDTIEEFTVTFAYQYWRVA